MCFLFCAGKCCCCALHVLWEGDAVLCALWVVFVVSDWVWVTTVGDEVCQN